MDRMKTEHPIRLIVTARCCRLAVNLANATRRPAARCRLSGSGTASPSPRGHRRGPAPARIGVATGRNRCPVQHASGIGSGPRADGGRRNPDPVGGATGQDGSLAPHQGDSAVSATPRGHPQPAKASQRSGRMAAEMLGRRRQSVGAVHGRVAGHLAGGVVGCGTAHLRGAGVLYEAARKAGGNSAMGKE